MTDATKVALTAAALLAMFWVGHWLGTQAVAQPDDNSPHNVVAVPTQQQDVLCYMLLDANDNPVQMSCTHIPGGASWRTPTTAQW